MESNKECPIYFTDYDKISDVLIRFDRDLTLKFNVSLSYKTFDGMRASYHSETIYDTNKYKNTSIGYSIRRNMTFYFSLDDASDMRASIMIGLSEVYLLKTFIEQEILPWYIGSDTIYGKSPDDGTDIVVGKWKPKRFDFTDYKYLEFYPIVIEMESGKTVKGIRMVMNSSSRFFDMILGRFLAFYQLIGYSDMYGIACSMLTYIKQPPFGINVYDIRNTNRKNFFDNL